MHGNRLHVSVTYIHYRMNLGKKFGADLKAAVDDVRQNSGAYRDGAAAIYGMAETLPDRTLVSDMSKSVLDSLYIV